MAAGELTGAGAPHQPILIVEDNALNLKFFEDVLRARGHVFVSATYGLEALRLAKARLPSLVLMDIQLPDISGLEIARMMKADPELTHVPIIAVTAFAMKGDEERFRNGGCDGYLAKPISMARLVSTVESWLEAIRVEQGYQSSSLVNQPPA
jgi:two-component system, cell cycle response regulator DivK